MDLLRISWEAAVIYCEKLAEKTGDFKPDMIVGISRGGLVPARILSDMLGIKSLGVVGMVFYKSVGETGDAPKITQELAMDLKGKRILLVDDVADTGKSLVAAKKYLEDKGAAEIRTAALHYKPEAILKPDYYYGTTSAWIVYPWERYEVKRELKE